MATVSEICLGTCGIGSDGVSSNQRILVGVLVFKPSVQFSPTFFVLFARRWRYRLN